MTSAGKTLPDSWRDSAPDVALNGEPSHEMTLDPTGSRENSR